MGVHSYLIPAFAAKHFIYGTVIVFTLNIPHSLLDSADCRKHQRTASVKSATVKSLNMMFYLHRIFSYQIFLKLLYYRLNRCAVSLQNRLTKTVYVCVCVHFQKHPSRFYFNYFKSCYFHKYDHQILSQNLCLKENRSACHFAASGAVRKCIVCFKPRTTAICTAYLFPN